MNVNEPLFNLIESNTNYKIINGDSLAVLKDIEDGKFDLIITSPPYNIRKIIRD